MKRMLPVILAALLAGQSARAYEKIETYMPLAPAVKLETGQTLALIGFTTSQAGFKDQARLFTSMIEELVTSDQFAIDKVETGLYTLAELGGDLSLGGITTDVNPLLDRSSMDALDREIRDNQTGMIDESRMVEAGNRFGAEVMVTGHLAFEDRSDKDNAEYRVTVSMKLTDVETSKMIHSFTGEAKYKASKKTASVSSLWNAAKDQKAPEADQTVDPSDQVIARCLRELAAECTREFNPHLQKVKYDLEKLGGNISKEDKKEGDRAARMAQGHIFDEACAIYTRLFDKNWDAKSAFNLAILHEVNGDMEKALEYYDEAMAGDSGNRRYREHRERMMKTREGLEYIADRTRYQAPGLVCSAAGGRSIMLKGESVELYDGVDGAVVRRIPGGREVELLEDKGDWCRVVVRNTEFWVQGSDLDR